MKTSKLLYTSLCLLLLLIALQAAGSPTILRASTNISTFVAPVGSLSGGTIVYIFGTNFSPDPLMVSVRFGSYPCSLKAQSSSSNMLACITAPAGPTGSLSNLALIVSIQGFTPVTCSSNNCAFTYSNSKTPIVQQLIPKTVAGGDYLNIFGIHRITDTGDGRSVGLGQVNYMLINGYSCSLIDVVQSQTILADYRDNIICRVFNRDEAGQYNFTENVAPGTAISSLRLYQTSATTKNTYQVRLAAKITQEFPHEGGYNGQQLSLSFTGQSKNISAYSCSIAGQACSISKVDALINKVTVEVPLYDSSNTMFGALQQDVLDSSTQQSPFIGSNGFIYTRYARDSWQGLQDWLQYLRGSSITTQILQSDTIHTQLGSAEIYGQDPYVEYLRGYLYVPIAGVYNFYAIVDDRLIVKVSKFKSNSNSDNMQTVIFIDSNIGDHYNPYVKTTDTVTNSLQFSEPGYYYTEIVAINDGGPGYFKLMWDIPNTTDTTPSNPTWRIDYFSITPSEFDSQIINVTVNVANLKNSEYHLFYYISVNGVATLQSSQAFTANLSAVDFSSKLSNLYTLSNCHPIIKLKTYSANWIQTIPSLAVYYQYLIVIDQWRDTTTNNLPFTESSVFGSSVFVSKALEHSPPIRGNYKLIVNYQPVAISSGGTYSLTAIPYNTDSGKLSAAFNNFYKSSQIQIKPTYGNNFNDQISFAVYYFGVPIAYQIKIDTSNLTGGKYNTFDTNFTVLRNYSIRTFYDPIPFDFLKTPQTQPQLLLSVNNIPVICSNCIYKFNPTLSVDVTSAQLISNSLTISLNNPNSLSFALGDISVSLFGINCNVQTSSTISSLTCNFPANPSGSAQIPAGIGKPIVHIRQIGYAKTNSIGNISIGLTVSQFSPNRVGPAGLIPAQIQGSGFPISNDNNQINIYLCGNEVINYTSISNQKIKFIIPALGSTCTATNSYIVVYGSNFTLTFSYDATLSPLVSSLSLTSASPVLKQHINISGSNFADFANTQVFLYDVNDTQKYQLTVTNVYNSTLIECILGGGKTATYYVRVLNKNQGLSFKSPASIFNYKIYVSNISPISGSMGGGYNLTITGRNFAGLDSTNAFVGTAMNSLCTILSITTTTIVCSVPSMDSSYIAGVPVPIVVTGRAIEESQCQGTCDFTFDDSITNNVTALASPFIDAGTAVSVSGFNLTGATVTVGGKTATIINSNSTDISFYYPALTSGTYDILIKIGNDYAYPPLPTITQLKLGYGISTSTGSYAGHILNASGNGMTTTLNDNNVFTLKCPTGDLISLKRVYASANVHTFEVPPNPLSVDQSCFINITQGTVFRVYGYGYSSFHTSNALATLSAGPTANSFYLTKTNNTGTIFEKAWAQVLDVNGVPTSSIYPFTITSVNASTYLLTTANSYLPAGKLRVRVHSAKSGFSKLTGQMLNIPMSTTPSGSSVNVSYLGGATFTISGAGFVNNSPQNNQITVCGIKAKTVSATTTSINIQIPPLLTASTQSVYGIGKQQSIVGLPFADTPKSSAFAFDNNTNSFYSSTSSSDCYVGADFGNSASANINTIKYMGNPNWPIASSMITGAVFQGSNDNTNWVIIFIVDNMVHTGWNYWQNPTPNSVNYRYIRFRHNVTSSCSLAEIAFTGQIYSTFPVDSSAVTACPVKLLLTGQSIDVTQALISYSPSMTSTLRSITPSFGPSIGGTTVHLQGSNFGSVLIITIDGIDCRVINKTSTEVYCLSGVRSKPPAAGNTFVMQSDGNPVILACEPFLYIDRWSAQATWGGEALPREGDSVYVPSGMTLLVDVSTPKLFSVIVDGGRIIFSDEQDMTFDANYFLLNGGQFKAGTELFPYQHKLVFTMYGDYYGKQLPTFGNKMIACKNCKFNMHGQVRVPTWTDLNSTVNPGDTTLHLNMAVDWLPGESIAIASSSFDHFQSEEKIIATKSADNKTLVVTTSFKYRHFAGIQTYGGEDFIMRSEVALLSRNIKMQGDPSSVDSKYGSHLMLNGKVANGLDASISYSQFTNCGQPKIVGRYCTHFHMAGEVPNSFVRGISVHNSFARVLTIHGTHYLLVEKNVGYHVEGHNIFIEDGIQTRNIIQDNLMISSITSFTMLQSDLTVASYWITNPYNTVVRNHAAGGDFYGFWYQIKDHPDGPSATSDICPTGMRLGLSKDNVAHSNIRFGLRIFRLSARKYPCLPPQQQSQIDPYTSNPSYESKFQNYTLWKNKQCGFLGQQLGYTTLQKFRTIDSIKGGMQFHKTNFTKELVVANNSVIVGYSAGNGPVDVDSQYRNSRGLIAARTDGLLVQNVQFFNFGPTMTPLQSCSQCYDFRLWVTGGKTTYFKNITYSNIQGNYIYWQKWRRQIFVDLDGSLLAPAVSLISPAISAQSNGTITPYRASLMVPSHCHHIQGLVWDDAIYCDQTITLRGLLFTNARPGIDFQAIPIKVRLLTSAYENFTQQSLVQTDFSIEPVIVIKKMSMDIKGSWAMPFASGFYYNVHFKWGVDFLHLSLAPSRLWTDQQGIVLRFNYTDVRQLYQISKYFQQTLNLPYLGNSDTLIDPQTCINGEYYHDENNSYLFVCISGRNKTIREWVDITAVRCLYVCPKDNIGTQRQNFTRYWSDKANWPNQTLPVEGANVTINQTWNMVLDCDTPIFNYVEIRGNLIFNMLGDNLFQAHYIWVKGKLTIGSAANPYIFNATIVLHGVKTSAYMPIDNQASGNKMLVVTGGLQFYGKVTDNIWNRLTAIAPANANEINVEDTTGWQVGDKIVIGASYAGRNESENVTITNINGKIVTFTPSLKYQHYGAPGVTITNTYGVLDTRSAVGLLSRNIRITKGPDVNGWGCRVLIYSYLQIPQVLTATAQPITRNGYAIMDGVEIDGCGQYDTTYAGLKIQKIGSVQSTTTVTSITRSSIHNCVGMCVYIDKANNVTFDNNVMHWARKFIVLVFQVDNYNFTNNFMTGARNRPELNLGGTLIVDDVAIYEQYTPLNFSTLQFVNVSGNLAQGSMGQGFVLSFAPCSVLDSYNFFGNTAGSCEIAFMLDKLEGEECIGAAGLIGYASQIGLMANPSGSQTEVIYKSMIFTDNGRGITLRYAHQYNQNTLYLKNSYFAGFSRPTCTSCYSDTAISYCQGGYAVRMLSTTISGQTFPLGKKNTVFDVICTQEAFDFKSFFDNVVFQNYKYNNPNLQYCKGMSVFQRHNLASDSVGSAYLTNTKCLNCDKQSWGYFQPPNPIWRGWFGGCGELDCTGPNNYIIHDQDGSFLGSKGQILANNSMIGDNEGNCTFIKEINGHLCTFQELAVMEYESIASDFNSRKMWPVYLRYDGGLWNSTTNGWREWTWNGPEPMNKRLARFWSVVKLHQYYNLTYASSPPTDSHFQIQKRLMPYGNSHDWIIVRIYYPLPNSLQVLVTNITGTDIIVKPFPIVNGIAQDLSASTSICGANNFHYNNGTIEFVLNGVNNCKVRVRLSNYVQISATLSVNFANFYTNNGPTTFLTNICAFLGIDTGRLKIVSVSTGSIQITAYIIDPVPSSSSPTAVDPAASLTSLSATSSLLSSGIASSSLSLGFPIVTYSLSTVAFNADGSVYTGQSKQQKQNNMMIILMATVIPIVVIGVGIGLFIYIKRMRSKIFHQIPALTQNNSHVQSSEKRDQNHSHQIQSTNFEKYQVQIYDIE